MRVSLKLFLTSILAVGVAGGLAAASPSAGAGARHGQRGPDFAARRAQRIAKYDANRNGKLDPNERAIAKRERAAKIFAKLDKDRNGVLSLDEFAAARAGKGMHPRGMHRRGNQGTWRGKAGLRKRP